MEKLQNSNENERVGNDDDDYYSNIQRAAVLRKCLSKLIFDGNIRNYFSKTCSYNSTRVTPYQQ